jgi:hypothetical protein
MKDVLGSASSSLSEDDELDWRARIGGFGAVSCEVDEVEDLGLRGAMAGSLTKDLCGGEPLFQ